MATQVEKRPFALPEIKIPHSKRENILKITASSIAGIVLTAGISYGVDQYLRSRDNGPGVLPTSSPSATDTLKTSECKTATVTKTPEATPEATVTPEILNGPDMSSIGLKYNNATEQYQTIDYRYGAEILNAGYFAKEVYTVDVNNVEKKTGGIVLNPVIVGKLIVDKIAAGETGVVPIPVDPSEGQRINIEYKNSLIVRGEVKNLNNIVITTDKNINLINFYYNRQDVMSGFLEGTVFNGKSRHQDFLTKKYFQDQNFNGDIFKDLCILGDFTDSPFFESNGQLRTYYESRFGHILGKFDSSILISSASYLPDGSLNTFKPSDLLFTSNYPVLMKANQ